MTVNNNNVLGAHNWRLLALFTIFALCVAVYIEGLFGGFLYDDYPNIVANRALQINDDSFLHWAVAALSSNAGLLKRPISMLSFAANAYWFGMNPIAFKVTNLVIHLLNGWLIYLLALKLAPRLAANDGRSAAHDGIALFVTGWWLLHPLNVSGVLYVVQRMNELSTLFMLAGLVCYAEGRLRQLRGNPGLALAIGGMTVFGALALFSKENGALIVLYALIIEVVCFRFASPDLKTQTCIKIFFTLTVALPAACFIIFILTHPEWINYSGREFTLAQRVLTEPRILFHYILWIFVPCPSWMGMYHDDIPLSTGILHPLTTLLAIAAWVALAISAWGLRRRQPGFSLAVAWFLVGHAMESTIIPLELTFEHRNYLPMFGVLLGTATTLSPFIVSRAPKAVLAFSMAILLGIAALTATRTATWSDPIRLALTFAKDHPDSARSQYDAGRATVYQGEANGTLQAARVAARPYFLRAMALDKTYVFPATGLILTYVKEKSVPASPIADLQFRLRNSRYPYNNTLLALMNSITDGWLALSPDDVKNIVTSALDNASMTAYSRAEILDAYGRYQFQISHDSQAAVSLTLAAAQEDPGNPLYQLNLAKLALALMQTDIATKHLKFAAMLDPAGLYRKDRDTVETKISQAKNQANPR